MILEQLQQHEIMIRLGFFFGVLFIMSLLEILSPRRPLTMPKIKRWFSNLGIVFIDSTMIRFLFPAAAVGVALFAEQIHFGLFHQVFQIKEGWAIVLSVIVLDFTIYLQHVMFHAVPLFWRIHRMHHVDLDFDVTTGVRFHPFEILLSLLIKFAVILLLGAPAVGVLIFEVLLSATSLFNHSNVRIPLVLDKLIRSLIVTPDMHRVHHSDKPNETNSNFGFNFSFWDRLMGTYRAQPSLGHERMNIGLKTIRSKTYCLNLLGMLWVPFIRGNQKYPINQREKKPDGE